MRGIDFGFFLQGGIVIVIQGREAVFDLLKGSDGDDAVIRRSGIELGARLGNLRAAQPPSSTLSTALGPMAQ